MQTEQTEVKRRPGRPAKKAWDAAPAQGKRTKARSAHDNTIHASRAQDERGEVHDTQDEPWVNPVSLPFIKPRPGMVQRYIHVSDIVNEMRKKREGWQPRSVNTLPKNFPVPRIESGKYAGCIGVENMVLCEMPKERNDARNRYFAEKNNKQTKAIDARLSEETKHNGTGFGKAEVERTTKVVREVAVAADK